MDISDNERMKEPLTLALLSLPHRAVPHCILLVQGTKASKDPVAANGFFANEKMGPKCKDSLTTTGKTN